MIVVPRQSEDCRAKFLPWRRSLPAANCSVYAIVIGPRGQHADIAKRRAWHAWASGLRMYQEAREQCVLGACCIPRGSIFRSPWYSGPSSPRWCRATILTALFAVFGAGTAHVMSLGSIGA